MSVWFALALGGCGGGGSATPATHGAPTSAAATLRIVVPSPNSQTAAQSRTPAFVSAGAQSITISIYAVGANGSIATVPSSTTNLDLVPSVVCSGTPLACSIPIDAPIGTVTFSVALYSQTGEGGSVLATFLPSAQHEFSIVLNTNNVLGISLDGVPASLNVSSVPATFTAGTPATATITVVARDASGNIIVGADPYATAIALVDNDPTGNTSLSTSSVVSPASTVALTYGGGPLSGSSFDLAAQYPATPAVTANVSIGILNTTGVTAVPAVLAFLSPAQPPLDVAYGEASYTGGFTVNAASCSGIATVLDLGGTLHVTPTGAGSCSVTISDNGGRSTGVAIGVTQTLVVGR